MPASNRCGGGRYDGLVERHGRDHRAAREERRQGVEHLGPAVESADRVGAEHLVPREHRDVDSERGQVEGDVRRGLARVEHREGADGLREGDELGDRVDDAQDVRDVRERDDARAVADEVRRGLEVQHAVVVNRDVAQDRARAGGELLPRDEVRVVLGLGHDDLVAGRRGEAPGLGAPAADRRVAEASTPRG